MPYISESSKYISVFNKDSVQIPTQKSRILCFHPNGSVMRTDTHQCREASEQFQVAFVRNCEHVTHPDAIHSSRRFQFSFAYMEWKTSCTRSDDRQHHPDVEIFDKEIAYIQSTSVWTSGQYRPDTVLDKAITYNRLDSRATSSRHDLNMETL
jgi:hypothetical protein